MRRRRSLVPFANSLLLVASLVASPAVVAQPLALPSGFRVLDGRAANAFRLPPDVRRVSTWRDARRGLTYERYQQFQQPFNAHVQGAQLTVVRRGADVTLVVGAHYPSLAPTNRLLIDGAQAIGRALASRALPGAVPERLRAELQNRAELRLDPLTGRLLQRVESFAEGVHVFHEIDAETGAVIEAWDALAHQNGMGTGVHADRKSLLGQSLADPRDDLTRQIGGVWHMRSTDGRLSTYDARRSNRYYAGIALMTDNLKAAWGNDNDWKAGYERAAVDAQYYANLSDDYYRDASNVGGFDLIADCAFPAIRSVVHFDADPGGRGYANAFWDGSLGGHLVYGDGDGVAYGAFSGGQDVVSHELTHAVTQCRTPDLAHNYFGQPGALNEAMSDIMATAMEWSFDEPVSTNCRRLAGQSGCPDWWVGEDVVLSGPDFGFRNLADPESAGQPGHWQDRCNPSTCWDSGGVHINSTIPSHAYYLAVNGGRNARCAGPTDSQSDCDVLVPALGLQDATEIFFAGFGLLTEAATFCEAHDVTLAAAETLFPGSEGHQASIELAWAAVGRGAAACGSAGGLTVSPRSIAVAAGDSGTFAVSVAGSPHITVTGAAEAVATVRPTVGGATIEMAVPAEMADGVYPLTVSADNGTTVRRAYAALVVDGTPPAVAVSSVSIAPGGQISSSGSIQLRVDWFAEDDQSGIASAHLQSNPNNTSYANAASGDGPSTLLAGGANYRFRVTATDGVGNRVTSAESGPWTIGRFQEGAAVYHGSWSAAAASTGWGTVRYSTRRGARVSFDFTGTDVAWISTKAPNRGKAKVYIDGALVRKVDLYAASKLTRRAAFTATGLAQGPHTVTILVLGTAGRPRVDVDGFVTLSQ